MIDNNKVKHIASLAKLNIKDEEMEKYQKQLGDILTEIEKILEVDVNDDIMISPSDNENCYSNDLVGNHISKEEAFLNSKSVKGDYIAVPKVLEGEE